MGAELFNASRYSFLRNLFVHQERALLKLTYRVADPFVEQVVEASEDLRRRVLGPLHDVELRLWPGDTVGIGGASEDRRHLGLYRVGVPAAGEAEGEGVRIERRRPPFGVERLLLVGKDAEPPVVEVTHHQHERVPPVWLKVLCVIYDDRIELETHARCRFGEQRDRLRVPPLPPWVIGNEVVGVDENLTHYTTEIPGDDVWLRGELGVKGIAKQSVETDEKDGRAKVGQPASSLDSKQGHVAGVAR